jgi:hypothetical protein
MTNYQRASEMQRHDKALKDAYMKDLVKEQKAYADSADLLQKVYDHAVVNRAEVYGLLKKAIWYRDFYAGIIADYPQEDTYAGNQVAFLSPEQAAKLKEKYAENSTD